MGSSRVDLDIIRCIFYSEFHPTAGPKLVYQVHDVNATVKGQV